MKIVECEVRFRSLILILSMKILFPYYILYSVVSNKSLQNVVVKYIHHTFPGNIVLKLLIPPTGLNDLFFENE